MSKLPMKQMTQIAVLGAGLSGRAAYLRAQKLGIGCVIFDEHITAHNEIRPADFTHPDSWAWDQIDALILSPGIAHHHPAPHEVVGLAHKHHVEVISEVEFGLRTGQWGKLVVITGTNGKSTTTALTGHILAQSGLLVSVGGNLGTPLCALDEQPNGITVLELSSYQLETTPSLAPDITALLNITPDHLDRHGGLDGYVAAKQISLTALAEEGLALIGTDGPLIQETFQWAQNNLRCQIEEITSLSLDGLTITNPYLAGAHNHMNAAFASQIARACGLTDEAIQSALDAFIGLSHRLEPVASTSALRFVNDSKATNGDASAKALSAYQSIIWLAGGEAKAEGLEACQPYFGHVNSAHFYGSCAAAFYAQAKDAFICHQHETLDDAFASAVENVPQGSVILLSPAAASFDQFANFGARGDHFKALVSAYLDKHAPTAQPQEASC